MSQRVIALAGNPNCGKTTVFNALTGARQKVANWAGVTVEKKTGRLQLQHLHAQLVDLPGVYSLHSEDQGLDEQIARDYICGNTICGNTAGGSRDSEGRPPDLILNVVDAANLKRHLLLTHELIETGVPVIVLLNMIDVAQQQGISIEVSALEQSLGVPVIALVARRGDSIARLKQRLLPLLEDTAAPARSAAAPNPAPRADLAQRFDAIRRQTRGVVVQRSGAGGLTRSIDAVVLNRWLGIPIFLLMMYLMFTLAINLGAVFIDFFDILLGALLVDGFGALLAALGAPAWLITLLADGLGGGIQLVATFIPVIGFLYLCLSLLEDSGYTARAAFVVDRLMSRIGLPGNAFVPLIVGFGCNVPSVMAARTMSRQQDRLLTIAMTPFMSCGARLTVYALFAAAFFPHNGSFIVFALYLFGIAMAVLTGWLFRATLFSGRASPSFQEMPAYHSPTLRNILTTTWHRLSGFVRRAGSTIVKVVVVLTLINSISLDGSFGHRDSEQSLLSVIGRTLTPVLAPIGVAEDNWPATVGVFTGIFAKEAVVGTLDALYQDAAGIAGADAGELDLVAQAGAAFRSIADNMADLGNSLADPLGLSAINDSGAEQGVSDTGLTAMQDLFGSDFAAFCYLVLILLYTPCVAVIGAINRESGWRWAALVSAWSSFLAYWAASCLYQLGTFMHNPLFSGLWLAGAGLAMWLAVQWLKRSGRNTIGPNARIIARSSG